MNDRLALVFYVFLGLSLAGHAQAKDTAPPVSVRAVLHDPMNLANNLFYRNVEGGAAPLHFKPKNLSDSILIMPVNGIISLYDKDVIDPKNPSANMVARAKLTEDMKQAIIIVMPYQSNDQISYRMMMIEDSNEGFPYGDSKVLSTVGGELAVKAGEHKIPIQPGIITRIPPVKKVNEYEMAQTNFYYQDNDSWVAFTERQLQYNNLSRRIFIIYVTPDATQPSVTTIFDIQHHAQSL